MQLRYAPQGPRLIPAGDTLRCHYPPAKPEALGWLTPRTGLTATIGKRPLTRPSADGYGLSPERGICLRVHSSPRKRLDPSPKGRGQAGTFRTGEGSLSDINCASVTLRPPLRHNRGGVPLLTRAAPPTLTYVAYFDILKARAGPAAEPGPGRERTLSEPVAP